MMSTPLWKSIMELASAWEWFHVVPLFTASMVASFSQESRMVAHPKSSHIFDEGSGGVVGAPLRSGV